MKKTFLLSLSLLAVCLFGSIQSNAQFNAIMKARLIVNSPASVAGIKTFRYSFESATAAWGRDIDSSWYNVPLVKPSLFEACGSLTPGSLANKWALVLRGNCEFGVKAKTVQDAGAKGIIIVNQRPGEGPVGMAAGSVGSQVNIPVLMVSNEDGLAISAAIDAGAVSISLTPWGFEFNNDLALAPGTTALPPYGAIPATQMSSSVPYYRGYTGAFVANTGLNQATGIKVKTDVAFNGSPFYTDSVVKADTLMPIDSMDLEAFSPRNYTFNNTKGRYTFTTTVSSDSTDENPSDNVYTTSMEITSNVFCKSGFDAVNDRPVVTSFTSTGNTAIAGVMWGPLVYVNNGGYTAERVKFTVNDNDTNKHDLSSSIGFISTHLFKWVDANNDNIMTKDEMTLKSIAVKEFTTADSNNMMFTGQFGDPSTGKVENPIPLDGSSWYWAAVGVPQGTVIGVDGRNSYYNRANTALNVVPPANKVTEFWSPAFMGLFDDYDLNAAPVIRMIPFGPSDAGSGSLDSISIASFDQTYVVPAVAIYTSLFPTSVKNATATVENRINVYPSPSQGSDVTVEIALPIEAKKAQVQIIDAVGRILVIEKLTNVKNAKLTIAAAKLSAGNYYATVVYDGAHSAFKQFTVIGK